MGKSTRISWADATWNPWRGCTPLSAGCNNCYAALRADRFPAQYPHGFRVLERSRSTFMDPVKWKDPRRIFVCSLSDFFHPGADDWRDAALEVMHMADHHTYLLLTKRPERAWQENLPSPSVDYWLGVTAENQEQAERRVPTLLEQPAALHFVSIEPMLGPVSLEYLAPAEQEGFVDWVIVGAESGPNRRPCNVEWIEDAVDECRAAGVPVFVKQGNALHPGQQGNIPDHLWKIKEMPQC